MAAQYLEILSLLLRRTVERCNWPNTLYFASGARRVAHGNTFLFAEITTQLSSFARQRHIEMEDASPRLVFRANAASLCTATVPHYQA